MPAQEPELISFVAPFVADPPGTPASPRPSSRPRGNAQQAFPDQLVTMPSQDEEAFAQQLAERLWEYVQTHQSGLSAEELASLVQRLVVNRVS